MKEFIKFGVVGTFGFLSDAIVLLLLVNKLGFSIELSRIFSFLIAVFVTWVLNRTFTFEKEANYTKRKEYFIYFLIQTIGAGINYIIFIFLVYFDDFFRNNLIIPLAIASIIVMFFNFIMIKKKIYK